MNRNLTERLKKLSKLLADALDTLHNDADLTEEAEIELEECIEDYQDEIWMIEEQLREEAENEYADHHAKGWN